MRNRVTAYAVNTKSTYYMLTIRKLIKEGRPIYPIPLEAFNNLEYNIEKASCRHRLLIKTIAIF